MSKARQKWYRFNVHHRLLLSLLVTVVAAALSTLARLPTAVGLASAWDIGVICFIALTLRFVQKCPQDQMQETVLAQDQGRTGILVLVLVAAAASLSGIFLLLRHAKGLEPGPLAGHVALAVLTIVCSWLLTHVMFAIHYAHRYYRDDPGMVETGATGGLLFPGGADPHYRDFLYFSFVIGMTSQVSDVQVTSRAMRHLVLLHSLLSFTFYTIILALSINIVAGLI